MVIRYGSHRVVNENKKQDQNMPSAGGQVGLGAGQPPLKSPGPLLKLEPLIPVVLLEPQLGDPILSCASRACTQV